MLKSKSTLNFVMLFAALLGLIFVIGCGGSAEKQEMSDLLKLYSDAVNEYQAADETKRAELKEKIESYRLKCSNTISELELNNKATPQVIKELEKEYKEITKKYASLAS
jgi:predicted ribosome quality control (RQC) complex YloA/Tae2 family protein